MDASPTTENRQRRSGRHWALIISLAFLLGCAGVFWRLWADNSAARAKSERELSIIKELEDARSHLKAMLALSPCEAKARLAQEEKGQTLSMRSSLAPQDSPKPAQAAGLPLATIENSCVFVVSTDGKSRLFTGSGFFVAPGYVVTNRHVVEPGRGVALVTNHSLGKAARATVQAVGKDADEDFALLAVDLPAGRTPPVLPLSGCIQKTDKVGAWGFPSIIGKSDPNYGRLLRGEDIRSVPELSYTEGVVSAILPRSPGMIVHTASISPGNSGGPLLNEKGEIVGVNTMITLDASSYRQASIALDAKALEKFLSAHGINATRN